MSESPAFKDIHDFTRQVGELFADRDQAKHYSHEDFVTLSQPRLYKRMVYKLSYLAMVGRGFDVEQKLLTEAWSHFSKLAEEERAQGGAVLFWRKVPKLENVILGLEDSAYEHYDQGKPIDLGGSGSVGVIFECRHGVLPLDLRRWEPLPEHLGISETSDIIQFASLNRVELQRPYP
jgi:hypothetical protein